MRWSRFALGLLPALPVVVIALYVAIAGDTRPSETDESATTTKPGPGSPVAKTRPSVKRRPIARPGASSRPGSLTPPSGPGSDVGSVAEDSTLGRCCAELKRYGRATTPKFRGLYAGLSSMCQGAGGLPSEGDQEVVLEKIRKNLEDQQAPYVPPSCR